MTLFEIIILAFALALDAMLVCFSFGLVISEKRIKNSLMLAFSFGFFQFLMPIIGWFLTGYIYKYIKDYAKWVVFIVFIYLAIKFFIEAFSKTEDIKTNCISLWCLFYLSIATSIDALGAGISFKLLSVEILLPCLLIGIITFLLSVTGFYISLVLKNINSKILGTIAGVLFVYLALSAIDIV